MTFEQTFKNIDDTLYKDAGADSELDYIEQTSWVLFMCYLNSLEEDRKDEAELRGETYEHIIDEEYRWENWAMPKKADGEYDQKNALTGPDLIDFVDGKLFPYLRAFKLTHSENPQTLEYKIGEIFGELKNRVQSGYNMRDILESIDTLPLKNSKDRHELSFLYETKIKNMGNAGRNGGQYYTPRPLIRAMIAVTNPQIGETIYDGAAGSCGFLCEAYEYLHDRMEQNTANLTTLQQHTLYGREKKSLAYIIGVMNMILHGIEAPNLVHINTLAMHDKQVQQKDRYDIVLANPPFGGKERPEVQQPFDIKTSETAFLFLEHFIRYMKTGGRAAIVIKNTFLSNTDNASVSLRKYLLETCNLHTVLDMPSGTFLGAGVKTVVLFFEKGSPTTNTWYYQLDAGRNMGKTNPLNDKDLAEFIELQKTKAETEKSWNVPVIASEAKQSPTEENGYDLSVKNPNTPEEAPLRAPQQILAEMEQLDQDTRQLLDSIKELI
ncbi:MAG TPA: type I restriction endonuclease subunit M [Flavobacteriales bacterium]|nr:type I restriction endonuclease subunit M [Flavobacteriales bacterium]